MWRDSLAALRAARGWLGRWRPHWPTVRAIRGATTVECDNRDAVLDATRELLEEIARRNRLAPSAIISVIFTSTPDLTSVFPAEAARTLGWRDVPLLDAMEVPVPGAPARCIRALLHVHGRHPAAHVYIRGAAGLRPDLTAA
jgi:chorismate mutase